MTDSAALSAAPPRAILMWSDGLDIFAEFPGPDNRPVVLRYPLSEQGLSKALALVIKTKYDASGRAYIPPEPKNQPGTSAQRDNIRHLMRKAGILG